DQHREQHAPAPASVPAPTPSHIVKNGGVLGRRESEASVERDATRTSKAVQGALILNPSMVEEVEREVEDLPTRQEEVENRWRAVRTESSRARTVSNVPSEQPQADELPSNMR